MAIHKSAYDTLGANYYRGIQQIKEHVYTAYNFGDLTQVRPGVYCVNNLGERSGSIPVYNYPVVIKLPDGSLGEQGNPYGKAIVVFDARPFLSSTRDVHRGGLMIRDHKKFQAQVLLAQLALMWHEGDQNKVLEFSDFPFAIFSWWIGEVVGKRYSLDNNLQMQLMILGGIWYQSNYVDLPQVTDLWKAELISMINRVVGIRSTEIEDIVNKYPVINSISEFIAACKEQTDSRKLDGFNESVFTTTIGGQWFGATGKEQIVVACEYPPMWITLVLQSLIDTGYKPAALTRVTERNSFKKMQVAFGQSVGPLSEYQI